MHPPVQVVEKPSMMEVRSDGPESVHSEFAQISSLLSRIEIPFTSSYDDRRELASLVVLLGRAYEPLLPLVCASARRYLALRQIDDSDPESPNGPGNTGRTRRCQPMPTACSPM